MFEALISGLIAGFLWLDRYQLFQLLLSRPIISAPLTGLILGDIGAGCSIGLMYELLWLRRPPVGGYIAPDTTLASISATAISIQLMGKFPMNVLATGCLSFFITYPLTIIASRVDGVFRIILGRVALMAEAAILNDQEKSLVSYMATGLVLGFISAFLMVTIYVTLGFHALGWLAQFVPQSYYNLLDIGFYSIVMIGICDLIVGFTKTYQLRIFVIGLILSISLCYIFSQL